ncbi:MAG: glycosyltransferase [Phycisphaerae bacterium]|nr:glycosyltransferase [Phycisphaerae bacterium]
MGGVSVSLPVARAAPGLRSAAGAILAQTHADLDVMIVLNGADDSARASAAALAARDDRVRVIELARPHLAAALNASLRAAKHELVARMDADDWCPPERIALQVRAMEDRPRLAAIGSAWELADPGGRVFSRVFPPTDERCLRWRLLLGNPLAHGSMMLRRSAVLEAGGYDESLERAQDFELWLRLSRTARVGSVPDVLYRHTGRDESRPARSSPDQAEIVSRLLTHEWRGLPPSARPEDIRAGVRDALSDVGHAVGRTAIETALAEEGPTREGLLAWLWDDWHSPPVSRRAIDAGRSALVREATAELAAAGAKYVYLWGAGHHTRLLLQDPGSFRVPVAGIVDDRVRGSRYGFEIIPPDRLRAGDVALLSSDWHEEAMWRSSEPHRARGVRVRRLYDRG